MTRRAGRPTLAGVTDVKQRGSSDVLRSQGAFVVQFSDATSFARDELAGRVEHVRSGHAVRFASLAQLLDFFAAELARASSCTGTAAAGAVSRKRRNPEG